MNKMSKVKITDFFNTDYVDQASYDNLRKIASLVDGQKNAARKALWTVSEKNIKSDIKVSQLDSKVAEFADYLHGSLAGVIVNLAQNYVGTNNINLLSPEGGFGKRFDQEAGAARYIFTYGTDDFFKIFDKNDTPNLKHQTFEGQQIEPMFFVPDLPILLINGSEGVSSGFAQKILPRNPANVKKYILEKLSGKTPNKNLLIPSYNGFDGIIEQGENHTQWEIKGIVTRTSATKVTITEVPIGYNLTGYISVLDDLEDKKIIQSYRDKSEKDKFLFEVTIQSKTLKEWTDDELLNKLKLVKRVSENYTVINEDNKIQVFDYASEILDRYIEIKLEYMDKRKSTLIAKYDDDIRFDFSKYEFIKMIVNDELIINKRKKADIIKDIDPIANILERDGSYDYLLNMQISSLTEERMKKLEDDMKAKHDILKKLKATSPAELWKNEL